MLGKTILYREVSCWRHSEMELRRGLGEKVTVGGRPGSHLPCRSSEPDKPHTLQGLRTGAATHISDARNPMEKSEEQWEPMGIIENNGTISLHLVLV